MANGGKKVIFLQLEKHLVVQMQEKFKKVCLPRPQIHHTVDGGYTQTSDSESLTFFGSHLGTCPLWVAYSSSSRHGKAVQIARHLKV